eukprot:TRINITY_DN39511_c0_g1_i1.p1 TRINITY_DN39511_c0_g1~~TRINITY_DN39511_c0_g1_i1.p1  ORF type:complete len:401 (+),score=79.01 TRINITY_DN39511_c0_g1_i1:34-1236(+)
MFSQRSSSRALKAAAVLTLTVAAGVLSGASASDLALGKEQDCRELQASLKKWQLPTGFWQPAFLFRNLKFSLDGTYSSSRTQVKVHGLCGGGLSSKDLEWQRPTNAGGDWMALTREEASVHVAFDGEICALTGLAVTATTSWPSLRLQFGKCSSTAAMDVPLVKANRGGVPIMDWLCTVSAGSSLCEKAIQELRYNTSDLPVLQKMEVLDLSLIAEAAANGISLTTARSSCLESMHWIDVQSTIGIDSSHWGLLMAMRRILRPDMDSFPKVPILAEISVQATCLLGCEKQWATRCGPVSAAVAAALVVQENEAKKAAARKSQLQGSQGSESSSRSFQNFVKAFDKKSETLPWLLLIAGLSAVIGGALAWCIFQGSEKTNSKNRYGKRVKQVSVMYAEVNY